jgi:lipopolysaccharide transport system permease protein
MKKTIYSATPIKKNLKEFVQDTSINLKQSHELGYRLFLRNLKGQYRQSFLGMTWALIPPLLTAALWIFLRSNVLEVGDTDMPYIPFVIIGTLLWQVFSEAILSPIKSTQSNKSILVKINFPRESLLLSGLYELIFNLCIKFILVIIVFISVGYTPSLKTFYIPLTIFAIIITGFSIGLFLTPIALLYQDIQKAITVSLPFLMYLTPIVYPLPKGGVAEKIMVVNPMATYVTEVRNLIHGAGEVFQAPFYIFIAISIIILMVGYIMFHLSMPIIIERSGS